MVNLLFSEDGTVLLRLEVSYGQPVGIDGEASWLDFDGFKPYSQRLGRKVSWAEDCEEWTRSLPGAYAKTPLRVQIIADTLAEDEAKAEREAAPVLLETVAATASARKHLKAIFRVLAVVVALAVIGGAIIVFTGGVKPKPQVVHTLAPTATVLAAGPPTTAILPAHVIAQQLAPAQVKTLKAPLNQLVAAYNMWVKDCTPLDGGTVISKQLSACMLPALTNMNSLVNTERSVIRALEPVLAVGSCRLALTSFDQQLYELHLGLAQTAAGISVADRNYFTEGLQTIHSASAVVATSTATTLPKACVYAPTQF